MWYEINVSKKGVHYFATHERSISTLEKAIEIIDLLKKSMPEEKGFIFTISQYQRTCMEIKY